MHYDAPPVSTEKSVEYKTTDSLDGTFWSGATARAAAELGGGKRNTAGSFSHRLRTILAEAFALFREKSKPMKPISVGDAKETAVEARQA